MKFKKIYIEITNQCNLDCSFCIKNDRKKEFMSLEDAEKVFKEVKNYTDYIYLHLMGEPLLHPNINEIIEMAHKNDLNVNITTNGYLIDKIKNNPYIRQLNISLQSFDEKYNKSFDDYLNQIFETIKTFPNTIINFRLWANTPYTSKFITYLEEKYKKKIIINSNGNATLNKNIFLSIKNEFEWPKIEKSRRVIENTGTCLALKDHIGILVNLDVVACCMDANGKIKFGNLKTNSLSEIINSEKFNLIKNNFENNKKIDPLCLNCNFYTSPTNLEKKVE